jgi:hypothetical protein
MERVEVTFSPGTLRQPGLWGKVLHPATGAVYSHEAEPGAHGTARRDSRTFHYPGFEDGVYLVFGVRGYHGAGTRVGCGLLFGVLAGSHCEWQFPGHLVRFAAKGAQILAHIGAEPDALYEALSARGYRYLDRLKQCLRAEGIDRASGGTGR